MFSPVMNGEQKPGRKIDRNELHLLPRTSCQRLVAPVVEIYSVSVHSNRVFKDVEKRDIYGRISVVDDLGDEFDIFVRGRDDPECIHLNAALLLSDPCKPVSVELSSTKTHVRMLLLDKAHDDVVIARGMVRLEPSNGKLKYGFVNGDNGGFASVHYAIFPYAVIATVQVLYFSKDHDFDLFKDTQKPDYDEDNYDSDGGFLDEHFDMHDNVNYDNLVCGTSIAGVYGTVTAANDSVSDASVLFRLPPEKCVQVTSGSFIKLSRSVVAVPACSSLRIEVDLSDCNTQLPIGRSSVEFIPRDSMKFKKDIIGECGRIRVRVKWRDAYQQLDRARELKLPSNGHVALPCRMPPALLMNYHPKIELFTVFVHGNDFEPLSIYGKITVTSADYCIYKRGANCPQQCPASGTNVQLDCHRSFYLVDDFGLWVKLKDIK